MSADRTILKLAANAAGLFWIDDSPENQVGITIQRPEGDGVYNFHWNPLDDDGDALRLAATLRLQIKPGKHLGDGCTVETQRDGIAGCTAFYDDKNKQMRQAIVLAAAEIGRAKAWSCA